MLSFSYFLIINKKINSPKNIYNLSEELNKYKDDIENVTECSYKDNLFPHSFLPFIYWNNPKCKGSLQPFNNFGFIGPDFPITNQKKFYDILILGGSVAMQFGPGNCYDNNKNHNNNLCIDFLGNELLDYNSIDGRPIKVFNGICSVDLCKRW